MKTDEKLNILLIDDQPGKLLSYEAMLGELGENLIKASSGREALQVLLRTEVMLVLMDVSMPEVDGFELADIIRQHPRFQKTAIIFVSAVHLTDLDRLKGYQSGAVDYVSVPIVPELLRAKVRVFAELFRKTRELERLNGELEQRVSERTTELEASMAKQLELADRLREADRRKDAFLALLAHELRNPLAPVRNAAHIIRLKAAHIPDAMWSLDIIERQATQLTRLVDDLLDVSRITRGKIMLQMEPVDLGYVIASGIETSRPFVESYAHTLTVTLPDEPVMLRADPIRLTQVVSNLLNNAAKYQNANGQIAVRVVQDGGEAVISVRDQGIGIAPEMLSRVFDLFSQADATMTRAQGGLGIGLSLVKQLVELHGGTVAVVSEGVDKGSEFVVRLPCVLVAHESRAVPEGSAGTHPDTGSSRPPRRSNAGSPPLQPGKPTPPSM
jgi:signal transduction histidine kinase